MTYKVAADKHRGQQVFKVGDDVMVYLRKERIPTCVHGKFKQNRYGPYTILKKINDNAYVVDLLVDMGISRTFNVVDLTKFYLEGDLYTYF